MSKVVKLGFLGLGVVGSKVYELVQEYHDKFEQDYDVDLQVVAIYVRNAKKKRKVMVNPELLTENPYEVVGSPEISLCVECMGGAGTEMTRDLVLAALKNQKDVILSSKKSLALYGEEIEKAAIDNNRKIRYEATVGGGIPIIRTLKEIAKGETIQKVYGILNATSNYILSAMTQKQISYETALKEAKEAGYAENNPSEDVEGKDAAYKLELLVKEAMGVRIDIKNMNLKTIENVSSIMFSMADSKGEVIKQVAYAKRAEDGTILCSVEPKLVPKDNLMAVVGGNNNVIFVEGSTSGIRAFYGQGAGAFATASVMIDDLVDIIA